MTDYNAMILQLRVLTEKVPFAVSNLANAAALLYHTLEDVNWAGFYLLKGEELILGPFQGKTACTRIPMGRGVCGTAALRDEPLVVPDVHAFAGHIACDSASASEIVIPLHRDGAVCGVMDIDSPIKERFTKEDCKGLAAFAKILEENIYE